MIDLHQVGWSRFFTKGGTGVPAWYYARGPFDATKIAQAEAAFWTTDAPRSLSLYTALTQMLAQRYSAYPNVIGYEIMNEPPPGALGDNPSAFAAISRWEAAVRDAIRAVDSSRTVFVSCCAGGDYEATWSNFAIFGDLHHFALDFHDYWRDRGPSYSNTLGRATRTSSACSGQDQQRSNTSNNRRMGNY